MKTLEITLADDLYAALLEYAEAHDVTVAGQAARLIADGLVRDEGEEGESTDE